MTGRPSSYTDEKADIVLEGMISGKSLIEICSADDMPSVATIMRWLAHGDHASFREQYAGAREAQSDVMDAKIQDVADKCTGETAAADRVKIDAYKWRASKLAPKKYGDLLKLGGDPNHPLVLGIGAALDAIPDA